MTEPTPWTALAREFVDRYLVGEFDLSEEFMLEFAERVAAAQREIDLKDFGISCGQPPPIIIKRKQRAGE